MSLEARQDLVDNPRLSFTDDTQKPDLLNPAITNTYLVEMLAWLLNHCSEPIEVLAIRTDHPTPDGLWAHSGGKAIDLYPKNWSGREQQAVVNVLRSLATNPYCEAVGLGGVVQAWESYVTWPTNHFVVFLDNSADHIHCGVANAVDPPGARSVGLT